MVFMLCRPEHSETHIPTAKSIEKTFTQLPKVFSVTAKCHILTHEKLAISLFALVNMNLEKSYVKVSIC